MLSSFCSPLNSIPGIPGIISVVTAGNISVVIGGHFGGGDHVDGGDHFGGGTAWSPASNARAYRTMFHIFTRVISMKFSNHVCMKANAREQTEKPPD